MTVADLMTRDVKFCGPDTNLAAATELMWRNDVGSLPVLDSGGKLVGIITDRDICIAAGTRDRSARDLAVADVATKTVLTCAANDDVHVALKAMRQQKIRRVLVASPEGKLEGIVSLNDVALRAEKANGKKSGISYEDVVNTMKAICEHRIAEAPKPTTQVAGAGAAA
jgi:CBS domain-containing protein